MARTFALLAASAAAQMLEGDSDVHGQPTVLDVDRITCPVLASMYRLGALQTDEFGISERFQIKAALMNGTGCSNDLSEFQSLGISDYTWEHKHDQETRDRCFPFTKSGAVCAAKYAAGKYHEKDVERFLNIFEMNGLETVEHGFSTGVRGGNCNSLPENDVCKGKYPCEALFQKFYASKAVNGRVYADQIREIICHSVTDGDRSGEWSYWAGESQLPFGTKVGPVPARQWQMKAAMMGWLTAFGRPDEVTGEFYFTVEDMRAMMMEGRVPDGWQWRRWGCLTQLGGCPTMPNGKRDMTFIEQVTMKLPCDENSEWWSGREGQTTTTGQSCGSHKECKDPHAHCLSRRCTCGKGRNGLQMLFRDGACQEQPQRRLYFGKPCRFTRADNPSSPWTWQLPQFSNDSTIII